MDYIDLSWAYSSIDEIKESLDNVEFCLDQIKLHLPNIHSSNLKDFREAFDEQIKNFNDILNKQIEQQEAVENEPSIQEKMALGDIQVSDDGVYQYERWMTKTDHLTLRIMGKSPSD